MISHFTRPAKTNSTCSTTGRRSLRHENLVLQPGQPHYSEWEFNNASEEQDLYFRLLASGEEGEDGEIEEIVLELNGSHSLEIPLYPESRLQLYI